MDYFYGPSLPLFPLGMAFFQAPFFEPENSAFDRQQIEEGVISFSPSRVDFFALPSASFPFAPLFFPPLR